MWTTEKEQQFRAAYCSPKHSVKVVQSNDYSQVGFSIQKEKERVFVTVFNGNEEEISDIVEKMKVRAGCWRVDTVAGSSTSIKYPQHTLALIDCGVPFLVWGKKPLLERTVTHLRRSFPTKTFISIALFVRPQHAQFNTKYKTFELAGCIIADESTIQGQVCSTFLLLGWSHHVQQSCFFLVFKDVRLFHSI